MEFLSWVLPLICLAIIIIILIGLEQKCNGPATHITHSMEGKVIIITGGNSGIGWETALDLLINHATVIIAARNEALTLTKIRSIKDPQIRERAKFIELNLISTESIKAFVEEVKQDYGYFDILINNAGICVKHSQNEDETEKTFMTNHIGHVLLTNLLLPLITPKGRIIALSTIKYRKINQDSFESFINQRTSNFNQSIREFNWMTCYIISKLGNILFMRYLSLKNNKKDNKEEFKAVSVHPGYVNNGFFSHINSFCWKIRQFLQWPYRLIMFKSNKMGAQTTLYACYIDYDSLSNGGFYKDCTEDHLSPIASQDNANKMMLFTEKVIQNTMDIITI